MIFSILYFIFSKEKKNFLDIHLESMKNTCIPYNFHTNKIPSSTFKKSTPSSFAYELNTKIVIKHSFFTKRTKILSHTKQYF